MLSDLVASWRTEAGVFRRRGLEDIATLVDSLADDLERVMRRARHESVNLTEAAELSGFSASHLGRKVRSGDIPNAGKKNAPRIRLVDLPRKPGCETTPIDVPVLQLHEGVYGLEEGRERRRVRVHGERVEADRLPESLPPVG